jgi:hypothetical protein
MVKGIWPHAHPKEIKNKIKKVIPHWSPPRKMVCGDPPDHFVCLWSKAFHTSYCFGLDRTMQIRLGRSKKGLRDAMQLSDELLMNCSAEIDYQIKCMTQLSRTRSARSGGISISRRLRRIRSGRSEPQ